MGSATWFDKNGMANIFSFALIKDQFDVTDDHIKDVFYVDTGVKILDFKRSSEGLYYYKPNITNKSFLQSVEKNKKFYSNNQLEKAKRARELLHTLGFPSVADLKKIVKMNSIKDCPVTVDDVNLAERIYGPDVATIKGKATRSRPTPVVNDQRMLEYRSVLAKVVLTYINAGFTIKMIHADSEYRAVLEHFKNSSNKIEYNLATANKHVPQAERNIRTIKESVRATYHILPFMAIQKLFIKELMTETANKLHFFPQKNARSLDCIYLRPVNNLQGGHVLYHFGTKGIITRRKVKVIPITASVIEAVERLAKAGGIKSLVLHNKDGTIFYDSSWIAGVDHTENDDYDNIYEDSDYESEGSQPDVHLESDYETEQDYEDEQDDSQSTIQDQFYENESIDNQDIENNTTQEEEEEEEEEAQEETELEAISEENLRRSTRQPQISDRLQSYREQTGKNYSQKHYRAIKYNLQEARVIAMIMLYQRDNTYAIEYANVTTFSLKTAIKKFGKLAKKAAHKEMKQLDDRNCWEAIHPEDLEEIERKRALRTIFFITQKSNGDIKGRTCADGSVQRNWIGREEVSSPTVATESIILTGMIEAYERRDVGTCDIPNAFVH
ncbi:hypothetical protein IV203_007218 [Nitzschia inconspicua]|uniref:Uncharacterized protein n=1 Tax=Nitzschia inconspicua TaxID=303405 RepID=A0A9K3KEV2_9STRA|nr:hypothetical protein IV203_007218 [Nitzschia inconspicua]